MEFNRLLHSKLDSIFEQNNLRVIEEYGGFVKLKSPFVVMSFSHDRMENSNSFFVGRDDAEYLVDADIAELLFHLEEGKIFLRPETSEGDFLDNIVMLLESHEGKKLLSGEMSKLSDVDKYVNSKAKIYTSNLLNKQYLNAANQSWEEKDYQGFIDNLSHTDKDKLPSSYRLKLKIAFQKIGLN
ncbi:MAG: hypothetical protein BroJett042_30590 [Bacteroidota bacterium]|nr:MAG: hypothetical protein BroJett042_30590 [Bacteroidota bacterium]